MRSKLFFITAIFILSFSFLVGIPFARAAIIESGPPILGFDRHITVGGGSIIPLAKFRLVGDGTTALTNVGVILRASSTVYVPGEINGISLYRETGAHFGFSPKEDIQISGSYVHQPATNTLIDLLPGLVTYVAPAQDTEFYVVASTTVTGSIVNGNAFDIQLQANYASTSAAGIGTAMLAPQYKVTLEQTIPIKISEVKIGTSVSALDEFIELYNPNPFNINLQRAGLGLHAISVAGKATNTPLTYMAGAEIIEEHGFFLIANGYAYSGTNPPDAGYATTTNLLVMNGGVSIATSTVVASATTTRVDMVSWNTHPGADCEDSDTAGNVCAGTAAGATFTVAEDGKSFERLAQGYPNATSTAANLALGGSQEFKGNGLDRDDNSAEFVQQAIPNPQNAYSGHEFPFGGGQTDASAPSVGGSWPSDNMTGIPIDMPYIGFGFSEPIQAASINSVSATTTVTLVPQGTAPAGVAAANLCASVVYNPNSTSYEPPVKCNIASNGRPLANTTYIFEVGTTTQPTGQILDLQGNQMDQNPFQADIQSYKITFTTGGASNTMTNNTPPQIIDSAPFPGGRMPTNISKFFITFSQTMDSSTFTNSNIKLYTYPGGVRTETSWTPVFSYNASTSVLTISSLPSLANNTHYDIAIDGADSSSDTTGVKSANGYLLPSPEWVIPFETTSSDTTAPQVMGVMGVSLGASGVLLNNIAYTIVFDDHLDASTATSGAVTLGIQGGATIPISVSYDPGAKELLVVSNNLLPAGQSMVVTLLGGSIKNISGTILGTNYTLSFSTEAANSDTSAPDIAFINADQFGMAVSFNEAVNSTDVATIGKYSLVYTPSGGVQQTYTLSAMAGNTIVYNAGRRTANISNIMLPSNATFNVTVSNFRDITGNNRVSSSATGTVMSIAASGGMIDPGMGGGSMTPPPSSTFGTAGSGGFMPPANIMTMNNFTSASSTYGLEIPISTQIPADGQIVITFPTTADFGLCCAATSSATMRMLNDINSDINGPGPSGSDFTDPGHKIGIKTITKNVSAKTITLTLDKPTRSENSDTHDFLRFGLTDIVNPSVPKGPDTEGYRLDVKTKAADGATILESNFNVNPIFIGGGGFVGMATTTIQGRVLTVYDGTTGLNGINIMLMSPILGPMPRQITTVTSGNYSFTNLPANNDYWLFTEPIVNPTTVTGGGATTTGYFGLMEPAPMRATSTSIINRNITLTATTSAVSLQISLTAAASTFSSTEQIDIFAGGPGNFTRQTITPGVAALNYGATTTLSFQKASSTNGSWWVSVGPAMPKDGSMMMGPPPMPNWVMPSPLELNMAGCPQNCVLTQAGSPKTTHMFIVTAANKTIAGIVKDASGNTISNAMVFAYSPSQMIGFSPAQTDTAGKFTIKVSQGLYNIGAFFPGMGNSKEASVEVDYSDNVYVDGSKTVSTGSSGANPFVLTIKRSAYTITGRVTDGTNQVSAPVFAYRTDGPGHADAMSDTSGNYTLYVDNGTWKVNAHIPGYGQMAEQTVTISGSNQSNINFSPSGATVYWTVAGTVFESANSTIDSGEGISGVVVMARLSNNFYEAKTGTDGTYTLRVPESATSSGQYRLEVFKPGYGRIPAVNENLSVIPAFGIVGTTTWNIRINARQTVTVNIKDSSGNFVTVPEAYIDLFDIANNYGNHGDIRNGTSTTILVPGGASTTMRAFIPSVPPSAISVASDSASSLVIGDILEVNGPETIKIVVNTNLRTITGNLYHTSAAAANLLDNGWIDVVDTSMGMHYGTGQVSTTTGYTLKLADGTYRITAVKPGYTMSPQTLTVSADATQNLIMTSANLTISGTVTAGGSAAENAYVRAEKVGGGMVFGEANASGVYTLSVDSGSWRIFAASHKYPEGGYSGNPLTVSASQTGVNIALTTAATNIRSERVPSATFSDNSTGSFKDNNLKTKITAPASSICVSTGCAGNNTYIAVNETVNYPGDSTVNIIGDKAKNIEAYSGDTKITSLKSDVTVELTYTVAELAADGIDTPAEVSQLSIYSTNEQDKWESLNTIATYEDSSGNPVAVATTSTSIPGTVASVIFATTEASHFSPYALGQSQGGAPDTPGGLTATVGAVGSLQIALSWSSVTDASGYYLYRDISSSGSFPLLATVSGTSYTNTGLTANTTYYYKVASYASGGAESAASAAVSGAPQVAGGGGVSGGGGGGSAPTVPSQTAAVPATPATPAVPTVTSAVPATPSVSAQPSAVAQAVSPVFNRALKVGMTHPDIKRLQQLLNSDSDTQIAKTGAGSPGKETNYFGPATKKALQKFQAKHDIVSSGDEATTGYGSVGPSTRAKLAEVFAAGPTVSAIPSPTVPSPVPSPTAVSVSPVFTKGFSKGTSHSDIKRLQEFLNSDPDTQIAKTGAGSPGNETNYFGGATEKSLQKFQVKHEIAKPGDPGYGYLGPKTRAKIQEVFSSPIPVEASEVQQQPTIAAEQTVETKQQNKEALEKQMKDLQDQLDKMLKELQVLKAGQ